MSLRGQLLRHSCAVATAVGRSVGWLAHERHSSERAINLRGYKSNVRQTKTHTTVQTRRSKQQDAQNIELLMFLVKIFRVNKERGGIKSHYNCQNMAPLGEEITLTVGS